MIVVCWKWVAAGGDERWGGVSDADRAALEIGLRLAEDEGDDVTVLTVGGPAAEHGLREAIAVGARRAARVEAPEGLASRAVAAALAPLAAGADWVVCGDASADRGSGSVPAFLAAELGTVQALGLVEVTPTTSTGPVRVTRRLDGGRREVLDVTPPAVLSVEGAVARLRRASLPAELAARAATIEHVSGPHGPVDHPDAVRRYRPRARALPAPAGGPLDRVRRLTDAGAERATHDLVTLDPPDAADRILAALEHWGYLSP